MEYILKNQSLTVSFSTLGGAITSIKDNEGIEYLWQGNAEYWSGQAPVLFPICGSIRNNEAKLSNGKHMSMSRHGIVRKKEFTLVAQSSNSISFEIESTEELKAQYPFDFRLRITYVLANNSITTRYSITNNSLDDMPFQIGGHPGFNCPLVDGEDFSDYYIEFAQEETCTVPEPVPSTGLINMSNRTPLLNNELVLDLTHDMFHVDAIVLDEIKSRKAWLRSKKSSHSVCIEFEDLPYLVLWSSANNGPFVALEPWVGLSTCDDESDIFEEKRNIQTAASEQTKEYSFTITVE